MVAIFTLITGIVLGLPWWWFLLGAVFLLIDG